MKWLLCSLTLLLLSGCESDQPRLTRIKYNNVQQLLLHEHGSYTLLNVDEETGKAEQVYVHFSGNNDLNIFFDLADDQRQWVTIDYGNGPYYYHDNKGSVKPCAVDGEAHLHRKAHLRGAGWNHGKQGRGQTVDIE